MYKTADILTLSQVTFMLPILTIRIAQNHGYLHNTSVKHGIQPFIRETLLPLHRDVSIASPCPIYKFLEICFAKGI
jgi:hypothetical protein